MSFRSLSPTSSQSSVSSVGSFQLESRAGPKKTKRRSAKKPVVKKSPRKGVKQSPRSDNDSPAPPSPDKKEKVKRSPSAWTVFVGNFYKKHFNKGKDHPGFDRTMGWGDRIQYIAKHYKRPQRSRSANSQQNVKTTPTKATKAKKAKKPKRPKKKNPSSSKKKKGGKK